MPLTLMRNAPKHADMIHQLTPTSAAHKLPASAHHTSRPQYGSEAAAESGAWLDELYDEDDEGLDLEEALAKLDEYEGEYCERDIPFGVGPRCVGEEGWPMALVLSVRQIMLRTPLLTVYLPSSPPFRIHHHCRPFALPLPRFEFDHSRRGIRHHDG